MSWIEVKATFAELPADLSPVIEAFRTSGIENTLESGTEIFGCIADVAGADEVVESLAQELKRLGAATVQTAPFIETDWENAWRGFFKPRRVGERFIVQPTWEESIAAPGDIELLLDPGLAFGTGDHSTTRMCLELMEGVPLEGRRVADVGCGSGILAIAACKLGAVVMACDIDPIAVEVARENIERNSVQLELRVGDGLSVGAVDDLDAVPQDETRLPDEITQSRKGREEGEAAYDVVISNIISATLIRLAEPIAAALGSGGSWIVSGIIEENWPAVISVAQGLGFRLDRELHEDGWVAARFTLE